MWIIRTVFSMIVFHIYVNLAQAETPVTPSGFRTQVTLSDTHPNGTLQYDITGGTRAGTNLFHSFGEFSVPNNHIANFLNDSGATTTNILGRVTGSNVSSIFGTVQTTGFGNANLYLVNPSGIVFGPNARINVGGSVTFTTADYLRLDKVDRPNAGAFHADPTQISILTSAPVDAFGFLRMNTGSINVQGSRLTVPQGHDISLVGGNITIQSGTLENGSIQPAKLWAPDGHINLATANSRGAFLHNLPIEPLGPSIPNINGEAFNSFGSIHLTSGSTIDVSQHGRVSIRSGHLVLDVHNAILDTAGRTASVVPGQSNIVLAPKSSIMSVTSSADQGPSIRIEGDQISITGVPGASTKDHFTEKPFTGIRSETYGSENAGDITLEATKNIEVTKVVDLLSLTNASGDAGNIQMTSAHGQIRMTEGGKESQAVSFSLAKGNTGNVTASAREGDIVLDGASLYTLSQGTGRVGKVEVVAKNLSMIAGTLSNFSTGSEQSGGISVTLSGDLTMKADPSLQLPPRVPPDSLIVTSSVSEAPSGEINITAKDVVVTERSIINSAGFASGAGGHLKIFADSLQVKDGAQLSSGSTRAPDRGTLRRFVEGNPTGPGGDVSIQPNTVSKGSILIDGKGSGIFADTEGTGAGGTISISTKSLTIQNGGMISASTTGTDPRATGGSIIINAIDQVSLTNGGGITASSVAVSDTPHSGIANAGNISINAGQQLELRDGSSITTQTTKASGGNIDLRAIDRIRLVNSNISTSVLAQDGTGGNIFIDPNVVILEGSEVTARAVTGAGGNITFVTPLFLADSTSIVSASSEFGPDGKVTARSNLIATIPQLESKATAPQALLQNRCFALAGGGQSTFLLAGRNTVPAEPGGWLNSPVSTEHWTREDTEHASGLMVQKKIPNGMPTVSTHTDETNVLSLRRLTPPGFLVRTFVTASTGCPS